MNHNLLFLVVWVVAFCLPDQSRAGMMILEIEDLDTPGALVSITDNGALDADPTLGIIGYAGGFIGNFFVSPATTAVSKPNLTNGPNQAIFDLNTDVQNQNLLPPADGSATLQFRLTDTDFSIVDTGLPWLLTSQIGGLTDGTVAYQEIYDPDNSAFAAVDSGNDTVNDFGSLGSGAPFDVIVATLSSGITTKADRFSLTEVITIEHNSLFQLTGFDSNSVVAAVPEPASCLAWAFGVAVLLCGPRYRKRKGRAKL